MLLLEDVAKLELDWADFIRWSCDFNNRRHCANPSLGNSRNGYYSCHFGLLAFREMLLSYNDRSIGIFRIRDKGGLRPENPNYPNRGDFITLGGKSDQWGKWGATLYYAIDTTGLIYGSILGPDENVHDNPTRIEKYESEDALFFGFPLDEPFGRDYMSTRKFYYSKFDGNNRIRYDTDSRMYHTRLYNFDVLSGEANNGFGRSAVSLEDFKNKHLPIAKPKVVAPNCPVEFEHLYVSNSYDYNRKGIIIRTDESSSYLPIIELMYSCGLKWNQIDTIFVKLNKTTISFITSGRVCSSHTHDFHESLEGRISYKDFNLVGKPVQTKWSYRFD